MMEIQKYEVFASSDDLQQWQLETEVEIVSIQPVIYFDGDKAGRVGCFVVYIEEYCRHGVYGHCIECAAEFN